MKKKLASILVAAALALAMGPAAYAQLVAVGPTDPLTGFPTFFQDQAGVILGQCDVVSPDGLGANNPPCAGMELVDFAGGFVQGNIVEAIYYGATAEVAGPNGELFILIGALEMANLPPESVLNFVLIRLRNLVVAGNYSVVTPWGAFGPFATEPADNQGRIPDITVEVAGATGVTGVAPPGCPGPFQGALPGPIQTFLPNTAVAPAGFFGDGVTAAPLAPPAGFVLPAGGALNFQVTGAVTAQTDLFVIEGKIGGVVGTVPLTQPRAVFARTGRVAGRVLISADSLAGTTVTAAGDLVALPPPAPTPVPEVAAAPGNFFANVALTDAATQLPAKVNVTAARPADPLATPSTTLVTVTDNVFISQALFNMRNNRLSILARSSDRRTPATARPVLTAFDENGVQIGTTPLNRAGRLNVILPVMPQKVEVRSSAGGSATVFTEFR